ncbi:MAG: dual specificity protein phosphatase family protein [Zestosphaera sp.]
MERLVREYSHVVVLTYSHELRYDVTLWRVLGVEVLHDPVPDFRSPPLLSLVHIIEWILGRVNEGGRVYVHCVGGLGRSATVAAAYLIRRYGKSWLDAVTQIRKLRKGSLESIEQVAVLKAYETMLRYLNPSLVVKNLECSDRLIQDHLSKVFQIGVNASESLSSLTGISQRILVEGLIHELAGRVERGSAGCVLRGPPLPGRTDHVIAGDVANRLIKLIGGLAVASDKLMDQCVEDLEIKVRGDILKALLHCSGGCWSSCAADSREVSNMLTEMCSLLKCVSNVVIEGHHGVRMKSSNIPQESS